MDAGAFEGGQGVDGEQEDLCDGEEPEAETQSVAAAVSEEQDQRPDEVELLFYGQGPEVVERQGRGALERDRGQMGEVLKKEEKDGQRPELAEGCAAEDAGNGC